MIDDRTRAEQLLDIAGVCEDILLTIADVATRRRPLRDYEQGLHDFANAFVCTKNSMKNTLRKRLIVLMMIPQLVGVSARSPQAICFGT